MRLKRGTGFLIGTARAVMTIAQSVLVAELRISWRGGNSRHVATQKALEICGAKHDHVTRGAFTGFDGYLEKLPTQMAGGTGADIVQLNWPWLPGSLRDGMGWALLQKSNPSRDSPFPQWV